MSVVRHRTMFRGLVLCILASLLWSISASGADGEQEPRLTGARRINAPYFDGDIRFSETAIAWFGRVTPTENAADVRVGYNDQHLYVRLGIFDRRLWYDTSPSPEDLTAWDATTLYLNLNGNAGQAPDGETYRFDAQLCWDDEGEWEDREDYQVAYRGDGGQWVPAAVGFATRSGWRGDAPNSNVDDRAWMLSYSIPFASLGLNGPPTQGTVWGLGLVVHDRDDAAGTPIPKQLWPETLVPTVPSSWGQIHFGLPIYTPPPTWPEGSVTIRQGLNGAVVPDGHVGGSTNCGAPADPEFFPTWGELTYPGAATVNIQNLGDTGDWPCLSRYYITFPLGQVPAGKAIVAASLTMTQWGNAGEGENPQPSLIQVLTVDQPWDENTLTWNNSPLAVENVAATWAGVFPEWPGEPRVWDVSYAAAQAYAAGTPLRLALYESDWAYHSGKYFRSSDTESYYATMRPTLVIHWGEPLARLELSATPGYGYQGHSTSYMLSFFGTGNPLSLTGTLPAGLDGPAGFEVEGTSVMPMYDAQQHRVTWSDTPPLGQHVTIQYLAAIATFETVVLSTAGTLHEAGGETSSATAAVVANPVTSFVPRVTK